MSDEDFPAIEPEEFEPELEFKIYLVEFTREILLQKPNPVDEIQMAFYDGWQIEDKIICPPFVMIIFSREKEQQNA